MGRLTGDMGKRYKAGNKGRKRKNTSQKIFIKREQKINRLMNEFMDLVFHYNMNDLNNYDKANQLRLDLKMNFDMQGKDVHSHGRRRRNIYYKQLSKFKQVYAHWKRISYLPYIIRRYRVPEHLYKGLYYYDKVNKRKRFYSFSYHQIF